MSHPNLRYSAAWHALEEAAERAWLDQWARLQHAPALEPKPTAAAPVPTHASTGGR